MLRFINDKGVEFELSAQDFYIALRAALRNGLISVRYEDSTWCSTAGDITANQTGEAITLWLD